MLPIILCFIVVILLIWWKSDKTNYWKNKNVIEVKGVLRQFVFGNCSLAEVYKNIYNKHKNSSYVGLFLGSTPAVLVRDVDSVQQVLSSNFQSFNSRGINNNPKDLLADNILFIDDYSRWKLIRQKITPMFTSMKLKNMFYIVNRCAKDFVEMIDENKYIEQTPFDLLYTYTTSSIAASIFGIETETKNTMNSPFLEMSKKATAPTFFANLKFSLSNTLPKLGNFLNLKAFGEHEDFFIGVFRNVMRSRREDTQKRYDFIDICLELQKAGILKDGSIDLELKPTDELLAAQAFFFFVAGTDTTANTLHFTLLELAGHQNILDKLHTEIDNMFEKCNNEPGYNDMDGLVYLDMVINESMRKYPPIGLVQRVCVKDTILPVENLKVDKKTLMIIPIFALHRDEKYYPNPDLFDPERFSPENVGNIPKFAYLPFGEGNHICIGLRLARLQLKAGLAWLLHRYTLKEKIYAPKHFEKSFFSLRDPDAKFELVLRNNKINTE